ncbi:hypothetical protein RLOatenuis_4050 [Rickettsiales bacterium]|nr:hypothetical protein RLOatenuis_4050 [Rickettsiales bacterium]
MDDSDIKKKLQILLKEVEHIKECLKEHAEKNDYSGFGFLFSDSLDTEMIRTLLRCIAKYNSHANLQSDNRGFACDFNSQKDLENFINDINRISQEDIKTFYLQEILFAELHGLLETYKDGHKDEDSLRNEFKEFDENVKNLGLLKLPSLASLREKWLSGEADTLYYYECIYHVHDELIRCQLLHSQFFSGEEAAESFAKIVCDQELNRYLADITGRDPFRLIIRWRLRPHSNCLAFLLSKLAKETVKECESFLGDLIYETSSSSNTGSPKAFLLKAPGCPAERIDKLYAALLERYKICKAHLNSVSTDDAGAEKPGFLKRWWQKISGKLSNLVERTKGVKIFGGDKQDESRVSLLTEAEDVEGKTSKQRPSRNSAHPTSTQSQQKPQFLSRASKGTKTTKTTKNIGDINCFETGYESDDQLDDSGCELVANGPQPSTEESSGEIAPNEVNGSSGNTNAEDNDARGADKQALGVQEGTAVLPPGRVLVPKRSSGKGAWEFIQLFLFFLVGAALAPVLVVYLVIEYFARPKSRSKQVYESGIPHNLGSDKEKSADHKVGEAAAEPSMESVPVQESNRRYA